MSLSPEQHATLEQLWAITASSTSASRERDERLLRENGWDVQVSRGAARCDEAVLGE
jgi:FAS-associated factor 2